MICSPRKGWLRSVALKIHDPGVPSLTDCLFPPQRVLIRADGYISYGAVRKKLRNGGCEDGGQKWCFVGRC